MPTRKYGWQPQFKDERDIRFALVHPPILPSSIDLESEFPPCYDQQSTSACTAHGIAGVIQAARRMAGLSDFTPSRLFIYYNERILEGDTGSDDGAEIRDGIKTCNKYNYGYCDEQFWEFDPAQVLTQPPNAAYEQAAPNRIQFYASLDNTNLTSLKECLFHKYPIVFGCYVYNALESSEVASSGILPMPAPNEQAIGGHCMVIVGYDDAKQMFKVRNSWGTDWGLNGYVLIPYAYITNASISSDFWMVRL